MNLYCSFQSRCKYTRLLMLSGLTISALFHIGLGFSTFTPPGTRILRGSNPRIYMDINPISNLSWQEYQYHVKNQFGASASEYQSTLPDSAEWKKHYGTLLKSSVQDLPVVGISCEQAKAYCNWRSERVMEKYKKPVRYRLPSQPELKRMHEAGKHFSNKDYNHLGDKCEITVFASGAQQLLEVLKKPTVFRCAVEF
jgi:hypothetical protein